MSGRTRPRAAAAAQFPQTVRCAIYTRKSTDEGLEQDFNSLDAQRLAAESFIASQAGEGWVCLPARYDDGGYTGANTQRPALQRLLADIEAGKIDCCVTYKVDRLSRSLLDFARIMAVFEQHQVAFVSVTQSFNSANSMGRLTLNILLSFAQFEREVISERTRDKVRLARQQGKWAGGRPVLGYDADPQRKLRINPAEAERVRTIFALYLERRGLLATLEELEARGWQNKTWVTRQGQLHQGRPFTRTTLHFLLTNPIYTGRVRHHGVVYPGEHEAIIDDETFEAVRQLLAHNRRQRGAEYRLRGDGILKGLLRCGACDCGMVNSHSQKGQRRYRYYLCQNAQAHGWRHCPKPSLPAEEVERFVVDEIRAIGQDPELVRRVVTEARRQHQARLAALRDDEKLRQRELAEFRARARDLAGRPDLTTGGQPDAVASHVRDLEQTLDDLQEQVATTRAELIDEDEVRLACRHFDPLWEKLSSQEQHRLLKLLLQQVVFDADAGTIALVFHPTGIKALMAEARELAS